jgi:MFS family permease
MADSSALSRLTDSGEVSPSMVPALVLGLAAFLTNFDVTVVIVALPVIAGDLDLGITGCAWIMDSYSLAFTGSLLLAGAFADRYGRRRSMLAGNVLFAIASAACSLAADGVTLAVVRGLQGVGAAFVVTGGIALIANTYQGAAMRTRAFSWVGVLSGIAMALGPSVGGVVASSIGWRWIFVVNLPACALVAWGVPRVVTEIEETWPRPIDITGTALLTAALCFLVGTLLNGSSAASNVIGGLFATGVLLALFAAQQMHQEQPIFDPAVFKQSSMIGIAALLGAVSIGYWAILAYLPLFIAGAFGWSSRTTGISLLAATVSMLVIPPLGGWLVSRIKWRSYFTVALAIIAAGNACFLFASRTSGSPPVWLVIFGMVLVGVGASLAHPQLSGAVTALVPAQQAGMASAVTVVLRQAGFAVGIAVLGAMANAAVRTADYSLAFASAMLVSILGSLAAWTLLPADASNSK